MKPTTSVQCTTSNHHLHDGSDVGSTTATTAQRAQQGRQLMAPTHARAAAKYRSINNHKSRAARGRLRITCTTDPTTIHAQARYWLAHTNTRRMITYQEKFKKGNQTTTTTNANTESREIRTSPTAARTARRDYAFSTTTKSPSQRTTVSKQPQTRGSFPSLSTHDVLACLLFKKPPAEGTDAGTG